MTKTEYSIAITKLQANDADRVAWCIADGQNLNKGTFVPCEVAKTFAFAAECTNELRSAIERYEFVHNVPAKYVLYINEEKELATTWTGERLGTVRFGRQFRSNMNDVRVPVTVYAINGHNYVGTYFKSAGSYARVRLAKN